MVFLNSPMLLGLTAVAVPVILHLLHRSRPKLIDWGAMRFLMASLTARSRRLLLEELLLLVLRCLLVALLALAMARPFLPIGPTLPALLILGPTLLAAAATAVWVVLRARQVLHRSLLLAMVALLAVALGAGLGAAVAYRRRWIAAGGGRDVALILDASLSMARRVQGRTLFEQAAEQARALIRSAPRDEAFALILAGAAPVPLVPFPTADRRELMGALDRSDCRPIGGVAAFPEALHSAVSALAAGHQPGKLIVIFTDGHAVGWDPRAEARWTFLRESLETLPARPRVLVRRLASPERLRNLAVADLLPSRQVIGTDRPVTLDVRVLNAGAEPDRPRSIELRVDGRLVERVPVVKDILPQMAETFPIECRFESPGWRVVEARLETEDDLPEDDALPRVLPVLQRLPVLVVEGAPSEPRLLRRAAGFLSLALRPREIEDPRAAPKKPAPPSGPSEDFLVEPTIVSVSDLATTDLSAYAVVILADVPLLPPAVADRLAKHVQQGGGLLVTPGMRADLAFYRTWTSKTGAKVLPAHLVQRVTPPEPVRLALHSFSHPALRRIADPTQSDVDETVVAAYWRLQTDDDADVRVGAQLGTGDPWLVERRLGKGSVILIAMALDRRDSNLPALRCFVPWAHETVYHLAGTAVPSPNLQPGIEWTFSIDLNPTTAREMREEAVRVIPPWGEERPVTVSRSTQEVRLRVAQTQAPGLYRVVVPSSWTSVLRAVGARTNEVPFVVQGQSEEHLMVPLTDTDVIAMRRHVDLTVFDRAEDLATAFAGRAPGRELWRWLALAALGCAVGEIALTRWIAAARQVRVTKGIQFRSPAIHAEEIRARMAGLVTSFGRPAGESAEEAQVAGTRKA